MHVVYYMYKCSLHYIQSILHCVMASSTIHVDVFRYSIHMHCFFVNSWSYKHTVPVAIYAQLYFYCEQKSLFIINLHGKSEAHDFN
jgi:hypothetical protein